MNSIFTDYHLYMVYPSWRKSTDKLKKTELSDCESFVLLSAMRGLVPLMEEIIQSQKLHLPEDTQDLEFVTYQLERLTQCLHHKLVADGDVDLPKMSIGIGKDIRPNNAGKIGIGRPKVIKPKMPKGKKKKKKKSQAKKVLKKKIIIPERLAHIMIGKAEVDNQESET